MNAPNTPGVDVDYNGWNVYDYPSIGQISELLFKKDIFIIFAVIHQFRELYDVSFGCSWVSFLTTCRDIFVQLHVRQS